MTARIDVPNLDCLPLAELRAVEAQLDDLRDQPGPDADAYAELWRYARLRIRAMVYRQAGAVDAANDLEALCDAIWTRLPEWARW